MEHRNAIFELCGDAAPHVRVTYRDTDRMGAAYYANYLVWFEIGRVELLRSLGQSYKDWEDIHGILLPVAECHVEYKRPAHYDDLLRIETRVSRLTEASITFHYEICRVSDNEVLAVGFTRHPFVDKKGRIVRVASKLLGSKSRRPDS
ncbi:MAG: acyl-CoA thioesterase [Candidatus Sumerlaeaceae bacterium]|nr:acyl-CoA thioesterase [Candidatus Sumerlaeaceae bacterium]